MNAVREPVNELIASPASTAKLETIKLNFFYGGFQALHDIDLEVPEKRITALIGPSGCGKSTFLRALNRINETIRNARHQGRDLLDGQDVHQMAVTALRRREGMWFKSPKPLPKWMFEHV